jgi:D-3-phosphoglycerate dehydrogenase
MAERDGAKGLAVYLIEPIHDDAVARLEAAGAEVLDAAALDEAARGAALARAEAVIVRVAPVGRDVLEAAPRLRHIAKHGVGVDNIDLGAARARGIAVTNTPAANAQSVAEHALALLLGLAKRLPGYDASLRAGGWGRGVALPVELKGMKLAVLGYGRSGRLLARFAAALGMKVSVLSRSLPPGRTAEGHVVARNLAEALDGAGAVSVHLPLTAQTRGMIGPAELGLLAPGAFVVNVARGGIVDEAALAADTRLGGFATDVFAAEPPPAESPLLTAADAILTPHVAGVTEAALRRMGLDAAEAVIAFAEGRLGPEARLV